MVGLLRRFEDLSEAKPGLVVGSSIALTCIPLAVAVVALAGTDWRPVGDLAQAALRQDSFWRHPPLVGTAGRIGTLTHQGNHPGPAMFWAAWPLWKLFGSSWWALQVATVLTSAAFGVAAVLLARRTFGTRTALALTALLAVLLRAFGPEVLTQPWNPYAPLVAYLLFVVACWTTAYGHRRHLVVAVLAGSYCLQCHVGYAPAVIAGLVVATGSTLVGGRGQGRVPGRSGPRRFGWLVLAALVGIVAWLPPLIEELRGSPGNLTVIVETFGQRDRPVIGLRNGLDVLFTQLDPIGNLTRATTRVSGAPVGGLLLLFAWAAGAAWSLRRHDRRGVTLDAVLASQVAAMLLWSARLDSMRFAYLVQWFWVVTALMLLSVLRNVAALARAQRRFGSAAVPVPAATAVLVVAAVTSLAVAAAARVRIPFPNLSDTVAAIDGPTAGHLQPGRTYMVEWRDGDGLGAVGFGLLLALERKGFHVGAPPQFMAAVEPHRVIRPGAEDAVLTVVSGAEEIERVRDVVAGDATVRELIEVDARSPGDRVRADRLRRDAHDRLESIGRADLAAAMDSSIWVPLGDPSTDERTYSELWELVGLGRPTAVFISASPLPPS